MEAASELVQLVEDINKQGDKVRALKDACAANDEIQAEVMKHYWDQRLSNAEEAEVNMQGWLVIEKSEEGEGKDWI